MLLSQWLTQTPSDRPVALVGNVVKTEKDFFADAAAWRATVEAHGARRAIVFSDDTYRFACQLFGAWSAGCVTILPADLTVATLDQLADSASLALVDSALTDTRFTYVTVPLQADSAAFEALDESLPLVELFTSGSTGRPVQIPRSLRSLFEDIENIHEPENAVPPTQTVVLSTVPHQHIYGLLWRLLWPLATGRLITAERLLYPEAIVERIREHANVILVTSPAVLKRLPEDIDWKAVAPHLEWITSSGGPLFDDDLRHVHRLFGMSPKEIFGSTELDGIAWRQRRVSEAGDIDPASSRWQPMPGVKVRANEDGVLEISSIRLETLDWVAGSDIIDLDTDGCFALKRRVDRIVKIEEKRVSLDAMEGALKASGLVADAKIFLLSTVSHRNLSAVVVPNDTGLTLLREAGKKALVARLREVLLGVVEKIALPRYWRFEPMMPVDERGKCSQKVLDALFDKTLPQFEDWTVAPGTITLTFTAQATTPHFEGHFETFPVLPGVTELDWAVRLATRYLNAPLAVKDVKNLKFQSLIRPNARVILTLSFDAARMQTTFAMRDPEGKAFSTGKIAYEVADV